MIRESAILLCFACGVLGCFSGARNTGPQLPATPIDKQASVPLQSKRGTDSIRPTIAKSQSTPSDNNSLLPPGYDLLIRSCDNFVSISPGNPKIPEVLAIKGSAFYNTGRYEQSRVVYQSIAEKFPQSSEAMDAIKMIAQSYYEQRMFDSSQAWYRRMSEMAGDGQNRQEALSRIAETIFRNAEQLESQLRLKDAATQYERVALEFPESKIADVSLYNAGLALEKQAEWSHAILVQQRLVQRYPQSKLLPKARFRTAKCYEKLTQWDNAADMYLRVVANHPESELAPSALYNAAFCFENGGKLIESATAFERLSQLYPRSEDTPDVLFKAGEIYGKLKDWPSVSRVNQEFARRFGNDADRAVQALCMIGLALYMQNKRDEAISQLQKTIATYERLKNPSTVNKYYAAKAQYTVAEIYHEEMKKIPLPSGKAPYRRSLELKRAQLDMAIRHYSAVVRYGILEWTARCVFYLGQAYEDFAVGIMAQQRSPELTVQEQFALELGIAKAVDEYFVSFALPFHERNVRLGIEQKSEDKYITLSKKKLTYLPFVTGENYLNLVSIYEKANHLGKIEGFALIAGRLEHLQKIAPFQERAIELFKVALEMGSRYQLLDDFYARSGDLIIKTAYSVGETYADVADVARNAPIPGGFDPYQTFVYKTKLLKQIEPYEDQAYQFYLKALKIAQAYALNDPAVIRARQAIPKMLFIRGRCYDLLALQAFSNPPFPERVSGNDKAEYRVQFEEIGLKLEEQAFETYRAILELVEKNYAQGDYVTHSYVRLFQRSPETYGYRQTVAKTSYVRSGPPWRCSPREHDGWASVDFGDSFWTPAEKAPLPASVTRDFSDSNATAMRCPVSPSDTPGSEKYYFRNSFTISDSLLSSRVQIAGSPRFTLFLNGRVIYRDSVVHSDPWTVRTVLNPPFRKGRNLLALSADGHASQGIVVQVGMNTVSSVYQPKVPGTDLILDPALVSEGSYPFDQIKNFSFSSERK